jgi:hypothetical protein
MQPKRFLVENKIVFFFFSIKTSFNSHSSKPQDRCAKSSTTKEVKNGELQTLTKHYQIGKQNWFHKKIDIIL